MNYPSIESRDAGTAILILLAPAVVLFALVASLTTMSTTGLRATTESRQRMRAFYLADSGAQIGNAVLRSRGPSADTFSFVEAIDDGQATVNIEKVGYGRYLIRSHSEYLRADETVELQVVFVTEGFELQGALQVTVENGVEVAGRIRTLMSGKTLLSGDDHTATGALAADQSEAVAGLAANPLPGDDVDFSVETNHDARIQGSPEPVDNDAPSQTAILQDLRNYAKESADVFITGSGRLGTDATGSFGTAGSPKLVHVALDPENKLRLDGDFSGYGTLIVEVDNAKRGSVLEFGDNASWTGVVLVYFRDEAEVAGGELITLSHQSKIIGGLAVHFSGEEVEISGSGKLVHMTGDAQILYSTNVIGSAPGTDQITSIEHSVNVTSYRLQ